MKHGTAVVLIILNVSFSSAEIDKLKSSYIGSSTGSPSLILGDESIFNQVLHQVTCY